MTNVNIQTIKTIKGDVAVTFTLRSAQVFSVTLNLSVGYVLMDDRLNSSKREELSYKFWLALPEVKAHLASEDHKKAVEDMKAFWNAYHAEFRLASAKWKAEDAAKAAQAEVLKKAPSLAGQARKGFKCPEREALRIFSAQGLEGWRHPVAVEKLVAVLSR